MYKSIYAIRLENFRSLLDGKFAGDRKKFAEAIGVDVARLPRYLGKEKKKIGDDFSRSIEEKLGRPEFWMDMPHFDDATDEKFYNKYTIIKSLCVKACCGNGYPIDFEEIEGGFAFRTEWLQKIGVKPENLEVIRAFGDSMSPTINDGDVLLIDRGQKEIMPGCSRVFVVFYDGAVKIKRVTEKSDEIILESDNSDKKTYKTEHIYKNSDNQLYDTFRVIGRVVWQGGVV